MALNPIERARLSARLLHLRTQLQSGDLKGIEKARVSAEAMAIITQLGGVATGAPAAGDEAQGSKCINLNWHFLPCWHAYSSTSLELHLCASCLSTPSLASRWPAATRREIRGRSRTRCCRTRAHLALQQGRRRLDRDSSYSHHKRPAGSRYGSGGGRGAKQGDS